LWDWQKAEHRTSNVELQTSNEAFVGNTGCRHMAAEKLNFQPAAAKAMAGRLFNDKIF
jgi:hypothetical protein